VFSRFSAPATSAAHPSLASAQPPGRETDCLPLLSPTSPLPPGLTSKRGGGGEGRGSGGWQWLL